ncbi:TVP38/TMEM64 family protein [Halopiger djelfimassiliensis]|uniref:TVP38/TMEM64 family protein n=1 Tax=Halopiger djelfimassiliensis TaxID=1293047 RepID=UPI0006782C81|nr:VTT domain-containing protein [Halopiger djelfimassiliensis]
MSIASVSTRALAGTIVIGSIVVASALVSPSATVAAVESLAADPYRFGLAVAALYLVRPVFAWPPTPIAAVVGYGYGVALGVPIALSGVVVTVLPVFFAARWFAGGAATGSDPGDRTGSSLLERTGTVVARYYETTGPVRGVTASRLAPIPSDISTCAAAVSGVRLRHLVVGTAIGELPWTIAAVVVGSSAATARTGGLGDVGLGLSLACGVAAVLLLAGPAYRAVRTSRPGPAGSSADN